MSPETGLSDEQRRRYARHLSLAGFGERGQEALADARVLVVGAGGLGSPVVTYLAGAGVGHLTVVDDDVVEISNLPRQIVHTEASVGQAKVDSVRAAVAAQNASVEVLGSCEALTVANVLPLVADCDVAVDCTDSVDARYLLNDACVLLGVPLVWASISQFAGQFGVVEPGVGPCYRCVFADPDEVRGGLTCEAGGVLGVLPGVMGTMQASEVVKVLTGVGSPARDAIRLYDALTARMATIPVSRDPECIACARGEVFAGLDASGGAGVTDDLAGAQLVIDVRDEGEVADDPLPDDVRTGGAHLREVPWAAGWSESVTRDVAQWAGSRQVVVVCAAGVRSQSAARALRASGVDAVSLRGGLSGLRGRAR